MSVKVCLKCRHKTPFEGTPPLACESCGAIFSKVEEAMRQGPASRPATPAKPAAAPRTPKSREQIANYAHELRQDSLYPTWRELVKWGTRLWYAAAIIGLVVTAVSTRMAFLPMLGAFGVALVVIIFARATKELSLMLTDLADAAVRQAAHLERQPSP